MDLSDYGGGKTSTEEPNIQKRNQIQIGMGERRVTAGWVGPSPARESVAFVSARDPHEHRIRAKDAYGISLSVLNRLPEECTHIFIHEKPEDASKDERVLEYRVRQYEHGPDVPEKFLMRSDDPQKYVKRGDAKHWWDMDGGALYLPRDRDVEI